MFAWGFWYKLLISWFLFMEGRGIPFSSSFQSRCDIWITRKHLGGTVEGWTRSLMPLWIIGTASNCGCILRVTATTVYVFSYLQPNTSLTASTNVLMEAQLMMPWSKPVSGYSLLKDDSSVEVKGTWILFPSSNVLLSPPSHAILGQL